MDPASWPGLVSQQTLLCCRGFVYQAAWGRACCPRAAPCPCGCLTGVVSVFRRGAGILRHGARCDSQLGGEYIIKGKYLRLHDVCLLEPTHARQDSLFSADSRNRPSCCSSSRRVSCGDKAGLSKEPAPAMRSGRSDLRSELPGPDGGAGCRSWPSYSSYEGLPKEP